MDITISRLKDIIKEEIQTHKNEGVKYHRDDQEELEEGGRAARGENADQGEERRKAGPGAADRVRGALEEVDLVEGDEEDLYENGEQEAEETPAAKSEREFLDANPGLKVDVSKGIEKLKRSRSKTQKESLGLEEAIAARVDNTLIELGIIEAPKPMTLEEQVAGLIDQFIPRINEQDLEETTFAYKEKEVKESKSIDLKATIEEAVRAYVKENAGFEEGDIIDTNTGKVVGREDPVRQQSISGAPELDLEENNVPVPPEDLEEAEEPTIKEWYNGKKFEALKKKWAK